MVTGTFDAYNRFPNLKIVNPNLQFILNIK